MGALTVKQCADPFLNGMNLSIYSVMQLDSSSSLVMAN